MDEVLYKENHKWWPRLDGLSLASISREESGILEVRISESEGLEAIKFLGEDNAPGPDGFPLVFFKKCWGFIKVDFMSVADDFQDVGFLDWRLHHTRIQE